MFTPHPALKRQPPLLCQLVRDWSGKPVTGDMLIDAKIDGVRALWIDGELVTREGGPIGGVDHIVGALASLEARYGEPMFFDGEMLLPAGFEATARHVAFTPGKAEAPDARLYLFDAITMAQWRANFTPFTLIERRGELEDKARIEGRECVAVVASVAFDNAADIESHAAGVIGEGGEGVVIKPVNGGYTRERSGEWLRIKRRLTFDCEVLGITPDPDSRERIAGLVVASGNKVIRVTAGFTEAERALLWKERAIITGRLVEIAAMEMTERGSLRQPRFERVRYERIWADD